MTSAVKMPVRTEIDIDLLVHPIEGGGFWGEVVQFPGCLVQADDMAGLLANLDQAIRDWLAEVPGKTEEDARRLAAIQGTGVLADESYPQPYAYLPPASWSEDDE